MLKQDNKSARNFRKMTTQIGFMTYNSDIAHCGGRGTGICKRCYRRWLTANKPRLVVAPFICPAEKDGACENYIKYE